MGNPGLSDTEARAHFSAWCVVAAPLLIGADIVSGLDNATLAILGAPELLAVDQDALGVQVSGVRVRGWGGEGSRPGRAGRAGACGGWRRGEAPKC